MKLTKEAKELIDKWFDNKTPEEVDYIISKYIPNKQLPIHGVSKSFASGKDVIIKSNESGHGFEIGEKVTLIKQEEDGEWKAIGKDKEYWWFEEEEAYVC